MTDLIQRALAAYHRAAQYPLEDMPSGGVERTHKKLSYVVLSNRYRPLAVYRVRNNGMLRRMKRWPAALEA